MKLVAIFLITCLTYSATGLSITQFLGQSFQAAFGINETLKELFEKAKINFKCGFPNHDIPILDPLQIKEFSIKIQSSTQLNNLDFQITETSIHNLSTYKINYINMNLLKLTLNFNISVPELKVEGKHDTTAVVTDKLVAKLYGNDDFTIVLKNFKVACLVLLDIIDGRMSMKDITTILTLNSIEPEIRGMKGGLHARSFNKILKSALPSMLSEQQETISNLIKEVVIPKANGILNKMSMVDLMTTLNEAANSSMKPSC